MVSALICLSRGLGSRLAGDIVLCFQARHLTLTVPLSTQVCKWEPSLMLGREGGGRVRSNPAMDEHPIQGGVVE